MIRPHSTCRDHAGRPRGLRAGFTVIEVMVVLAIMALALAGSYGMISNVGNFQLRSEVLKFSGALKMVHGRAAINGMRYQVVIDLDENSFRVECSEENIVSLTEEELEEIERAQRTRRFERFDAMRTERDPMEARAARFQDCSEPLVPRTTLPERYQFDRVLTINRSQPIETGEATIGFFPDGFVERSMIWISDRSGATFTIALSPLTGRVHVIADDLDIPRDFFDLEED